MNAHEWMEKIEAALEPFDGIRWGACPFPQQVKLDKPYKSIISVVVPHNEIVGLDTYTEPYFRTVEFGSSFSTGPIMKALIKIAVENHTGWGRVPNTEQAEIFETEMTELLSTKEAARRSGLGWIGKSNLLVTKEYGPRVTPLALLLDAELEYSTPMERSYCGNCLSCTKNCACGAIKNVLWEPGVTREQQVDYAKCSEVRLEGYRKIGRKYNCGKCIVACPYGLKKRNTKEKVS